MPVAAGRPSADSDVDERTVGALTVSEAKARAYRRDPYFRAGTWALPDLDAADPTARLSGPLSRALVVFKPDAIAGRRVRTALQVLGDADYAVVAAAPMRFTPILTRELWRYQFNIASRDRADVVDLLLPAGESLAVLLQDRRWEPGAVPASCRLGDVKGPADPALRRPDDLRSRLAAPTTLFNFIHTADEPADVLREASLIDIAGGSTVLDHVVTPRRAASPTTPDVTPVVEALYARTPPHDLDAVHSAERLLARDRFRALRGTGSAVPCWRDLLARCPDGRPAAEELWDVLAVATSQIDCNVADLVPLLPTIRSVDWARTTRNPR